jgi:hypothetical protein
MSALSVNRKEAAVAASREFSLRVLRGLWIKPGLGEEPGQEFGSVLHAP